MKFKILNEKPQLEFFCRYVWGQAKILNLKPASKRTFHLLSLFVEQGLKL